MSDDMRTKVEEIFVDCCVEEFSREYGYGSFTTEQDQIIDRIMLLIAANNAAVREKALEEAAQIVEGLSVSEDYNQFAYHARIESRGVAVAAIRAAVTQTESEAHP